MKQVKSALSAIFFAAAFTIVHPAWAGSVENTLITSTATTSKGIVLVYAERPIVNGPACGSSPAAIYRFSVNGTTPAGKVLLAMILTAYTTEKRISFYGKNTCDETPDTESVDVIITK